MKLIKEYLYEKFSAESDPIQDMEIGAIHQIKEWLKNQLGETGIVNLTVNPNGVIDSNWSVSFEDIGNFPEYIQFGKIRLDFKIKDSPHFFNLRGLPKQVGNDLYLVNIGKEFTEKEVLAVCDVKYDVILMSDLKKFKKQKSQAKYKRLGPINKRPSPEINDKTPHLDQKYSRGYQLWKMLEYILKAGNTGRKYSEVVNFDNNFRGLNYPRKTFSSGTFDMLQRHIDKNYRKTFHRYVLDNRGYDFFNKYKRYFDDGKNFLKNKERK